MPHNNPLQPSVGVGGWAVSTPACARRSWPGALGR